MLFSKWKLGREELNRIILKWFKNNDYQNIYHYFIDANNWFQGIDDAWISHIMFNNRFLNLVQGLEDYFRINFPPVRDEKRKADFNEIKQKVIAKINDKILKEFTEKHLKVSSHWYLSEKLKAIFDLCEPVIKEAFGPIPATNYTTITKSLRDELSHGRSKNVDLGEELHLSYQMSYLLLSICILKSLDIQFIPTLIRYNTKLTRTANEILYKQSKIGQQINDESGSK
jgi:hypothetical protein